MNNFSYELLSCQESVRILSAANYLQSASNLKKESRQSKKTIETNS